MTALAAPPTEPAPMHANDPAAPASWWQIFMGFVFGTAGWFAHNLDSISRFMMSMASLIGACVALYGVIEKVRATRAKAAAKA